LKAKAFGVVAGAGKLAVVFRGRRKYERAADRLFIITKDKGRKTV